MQGQKLMMMGTADEIVKAPDKGPVFAEDMPEGEQVIHVVNNFILSFLNMFMRGGLWLFRRFAGILVQLM